MKFHDGTYLVLFILQSKYNCIITDKILLRDILLQYLFTNET